MKYFINFTYLSFLLSVGIIFTTASCKKDEVPDRDKFIGVYTVVETCGNGNDTYDLTLIQSGASENSVVVINLWDAGQSLSATVSGNTISIQSQLAGGLTYIGNGTLSGNTLTINFTISNSQGSDNCNSICTRK